MLKRRSKHDPDAVMQLESQRDALLTTALSSQERAEILQMFQRAIYEVERAADARVAA